MMPSLNPFTQRFQFNPLGMFVTKWGLRLLEVQPFSTMPLLLRPFVSCSVFPRTFSRNISLGRFAPLGRPQNV